MCELMHVCKKVLFLHDQSSSAVSDTQGIFIRFCLSQLFADRQESLIHCAVSYITLFLRSMYARLHRTSIYYALVIIIISDSDIHVRSYLCNADMVLCMDLRVFC